MGSTIYFPMNIKKRRSKRFRVPLSGQALGVVSSALGLNSLQGNKTARRYFKGSQVSERARSEIIASLVNDLLEQGIFPELHFAGQAPGSMPQVLHKAIMLNAAVWDELAGQTSFLSKSVDQPEMAGAAYLRLTTIDLALRYAALMRLAGLPEPSERFPLWAEERGGGLCLRELLQRCKPHVPTRLELAETLGVSLNTVDAWLDGNVRPRSKHLIRLCDALAPFVSEMDSRAIQGRLRLHYGIFDILKEISHHVGRDAVSETVSAFMRISRRAYVELRELGDPTTDQEAGIFNALIFITGARVCAGLVSALARQESDPLWEAELLSAAKPWESRLEYVMKVLRDTGKVAEAARERFGIPTEFSEAALDDTLRLAQAGPAIPRRREPGGHYYRVSGDARFSAGNRLIQFEQARAFGDFDTALTHIRRAVELQPENAQYHFLLGATLGMVGKVEEGIKECWIADKLNPEDEMPRVEVGIILLNSDRNEEARDHLEQIATGDDFPSAHLSFNLGVARYRCGAYAEAMQALDRSVSLRGDYGLALDAAAQCAFALGLTAKGRDLAKRAHRHGVTAAHDNWRAKRYRKSKRKD